MDSKTSLVKVPAIPVVVRKGRTLTLIKNSLPSSNNEILMRCIKLTGVTKDQPIYKSVPGDFLRGEYPGLILVSRLNVFNKTSSTVAKFKAGGEGDKILEKNSNEVIKVIGQKNYDTVFSALCSVISEELRIRALLALLTLEENKQKKEVSVQTTKSYADSASQTDETSKNILIKFKQRKRIRRQQFRPYFVKGEDKSLKRVVIDPKSLPPNLLSPTHSNSGASKDNDISDGSLDTAKSVPKTEVKETEVEYFPELSEIVNEDSNFSDISIGNISLTSQHSVNLPQLLENPHSLLDKVDQHTEAPNVVPLTMLDGSVIMVSAKPMDKYHWATPNILKNLSGDDRNKLLYHQMCIHWKSCLEVDEDGYLPIHHAVMSNDCEFLVQQCAALKKKYGSVDVPAMGNMTALQMSINKDGERCTALLLQNGADPCLQDDEGKSFFHTAAEVSPKHLEIALDYCKSNARAMLKEDEDLWDPVMETQSDDQLAKILLDHICIMCDSQGYTPLMLAGKHGNFASVELLLKASPDTVNRPMPNCGSTALYLAVEAACVESSNGKNQSKLSDGFARTIGMLMEGGGDPGLENHYGSSVNLLLTEFNIVDLSVLIANKLTSVKYFEGNSFAVGNIDSLMLYRGSDGRVGVTEIKSRRAADEPGAGGPTPGGPSSGRPGSGRPGSGRPGPGRPGPGGPTAVSKVNILRKKRSDAINGNKCESKSSNVEIRSIKTIKADEGGSPAPPARPLPGQYVNPSRVILGPKSAALQADVPKYVKILPKVPHVEQPSGGPAGGGQPSDRSKQKLSYNLKGRMAARKMKKTEGWEGPVKKQRREADRPKTGAGGPSV